MSIVSERPSDVVFETLNRIYLAKKTAGLKDSEFPALLEQVGSIFANQIERGKISEEEIDSFITFISNLNSNYFTLNHKDLSNASEGVIEGIYMAEEQYYERYSQAKPVLSESDYRPGFKRL